MINVGDTVSVIDFPMHAPYYLSGESGMVIEASGSSVDVPAHYTIQFEDSGSHILLGSELQQEEEYENR
jgi:hypothetical protein